MHQLLIQRTWINFKGITVSEDIMLTQRLYALKGYILYDSIYLEISKTQNHSDGKQSSDFQEMQVGQESNYKGKT